MLDDWSTVTDRHRHDLLEIPSRAAMQTVDGDHQPSCTAIAGTSILGDPTVADAILDRLVHRAHALALTGPSRRKTEPPPQPEAD